MAHPFRSTRRMIVIRAVRDEDAGVWVAISDDLPGFFTEADTVEELVAKLPGMISDLLEVNGFGSVLPEIPVHIIAEQTLRVANPRAT